VLHHARRDADAVVDHLEHRGSVLAVVSADDADETALRLAGISVFGSRGLL
jgi:hypothetical protein